MPHPSSPSAEGAGERSRVVFFFGRTAAELTDGTLSLTLFGAELRLSVTQTTPKGDGEGGG